MESLFRRKIVGYYSMKGLSHEKGVNEDRYISNNPVRIHIKKEVVEKELLKPSVSNSQGILISEEINNPIPENTPSASTPTNSHVVPTPDPLLKENNIESTNPQKDVVHQNEPSKNINNGSASNNKKKKKNKKSANTQNTQSSNQPKLNNNQNPNTSNNKNVHPHQNNNPQNNSQNNQHNNNTKKKNKNKQQGSHSTSPQKTQNQVVQEKNEDMLSLDHVSFFSVIDGHAGDHSSQMLKTIFLSHLVNGETKSIFEKPESEINSEQIIETIKNACKKADEHIVGECKKKNDDSGACMVGLLFVYDHVFVWNVGDCRAVSAKCLQSLCNKNSYKHEVESLTFDHIAITEKKRISKAGGWVENDRVFGILEPSRAFGDFDMKNEENKDVLSTKLNPPNNKSSDNHHHNYNHHHNNKQNNKKYNNKKNQVKSVREFINRTRKYPPHVIISQPDIHHHLPNPKLHFIVMASDGIYDVLNNKRVVEFVEKKLFNHNNHNNQNVVLDEKFLSNVCHDLCVEAQRCGSKDDLTALVVLLV